MHVLFSGIPLILLLEEFKIKLNERQAMTAEELVEEYEKYVFNVSLLIFVKIQVR